MKYYRIEAMDFDREQTIGGYVSAALAMTFKALGIQPTDSAEELTEALENTDNKNALEIYKIMSILGDIAQPEIYVNHRDSYYCMYNHDEMEDLLPFFVQLDSLIRIESGNQFFLICKDFEVPDEAIAYEDGAQIVISNEDYEKCRVDGQYWEVMFMESLDEDEVWGDLDLG